MNREDAEKIVAHKFHPTSGFSNDDPTLNKAEGYLEGLAYAEERAKGLVDALLASRPDQTAFGDEAAPMAYEHFYKVFFCGWEKRREEALKTYKESSYAKPTNP